MCSLGYSLHDIDTHPLHPGLLPSLPFRVVSQHAPMGSCCMKKKRLAPTPAAVLQTERLKLDIQRHEGTASDKERIKLTPPITSRLYRESSRCPRNQHVSNQPSSPVTRPQTPHPQRTPPLYLSRSLQSHIYHNPVGVRHYAASAHQPYTDTTATKRRSPTTQQ